MNFDPKQHHRPFDRAQGRRSIRLQGYDYTQRGAYYVTIVTHQREHLFGEVVNGEVKLGRFGLVAKEQWEKLPRRFKHVELMEYVIMPNHMHGIIMINDVGRGTAEDSLNADPPMPRRAPTEDSLNADPPMSRRAPTSESKEGFGKPVKGSIPTIIRSYKSAVALRINLMRGTAGMEVWQRNYYEHVIRDERDLQAKYEYILSNPLNWGDDDENITWARRAG